MNNKKFAKITTLGNMILSEDFAKLANEVKQAEMLEVKRLAKTREATKHGALLSTNQPCSMLLVRRVLN